MCSLRHALRVRGFARPLGCSDLQSPAAAPGEPGPLRLARLLSEHISVPVLAARPPLRRHRGLQCAAAPRALARNAAGASAAAEQPAPPPQLCGPHRRGLRDTGGFVVLALAASTSSLTPARRAPQVAAVCFCVRLLCLPASWDAGADEAHGMLLPMQVRGRRTIVPSPYCQLTDPP